VTDAGTDRGRKAPDMSVPHNARVWNYWLGGKDNFEADRVAADRVMAMFPDIVQVAQADRAFLGRAVQFLAVEAGAIVNHLMEAVPSGSYLVISHPTTELGGEANREAMRFWNEHATPPITARTGAEISRFFDGLQLVEPGLGAVRAMATGPVGVSAAIPQVALYAGVARKP
jgi:S-adenosyl methyltransferase